MDNNKDAWSTFEEITYDEENNVIMDTKHSFLCGKNDAINGKKIYKWPILGHIKPHIKDFRTMYKIGYESIVKYVYILLNYQDPINNTVYLYHDDAKKALLIEANKITCNHIYREGIDIKIKDKDDKYIVLYSIQIKKLMDYQGRDAN